MHRIKVHRAKSIAKLAIILSFFLYLTGCATHNSYRDGNMDFGSVQNIAIMPFANLSRDNLAGERVRDVFSTLLLASGGTYVVPVGEVARGIARAGISNPTAPSTEDVVKLGSIIKAEAVIVGVVREYGDVRAGTASANVISLSLEMLETQTGKVVWSASTTKGGVDVIDRLFGGGGEPMNGVTEQAANDLINRMF